MSKPKEVPHSVICYWQYEAPSQPDNGHNPRHRPWKLVEAYPISQDGYPTVPVKTKGDFPNTRTEWDNWLYRKEVINTSGSGSGSDPDSNEYDMIPIPGHVVTMWSVESGVKLFKFNLPTEMAWLGEDFATELPKAYNWHKMLADGYALRGGTARAVEKLLDA
jgi:hypothetical protein